MTDFLPQGYVKPETGGKYFKFQQGDNRFRILSPAITGWIDWTPDKKPVRTKDQPEALFDQTKPAKHFWAFVIWDYKEKSIKILEVTQATIQTAIYDLHNDESWGNPTQYDINVKKTGEKMETKYTVMPTPPKQADTEILSAYRETKIDLNKLYDGGDPFGGKQETSQEDEFNVSEIIY
jgi:hypothetical protein